MNNSAKSAILIAGPTASGKSSLALHYASEQDGIIINADSMQVYSELSILTARPSADELQLAPHRLYGHIPAKYAYSTGKWLTDVQKEIETAHSLGKMPIIVGGTGLYFQGLLEGLSAIPEIPEDIRNVWRKTGQEKSGEELHEILSRQDAPVAATLKPGDRQRIVRALEVLEATGKSITYWQNKPGIPVLNADMCEKIVFAPDRDVLYARINKRFKQMMSSGAVEEVSALLAQDLDRALPAMRAIGVREISAFLAGELSEEEAIAEAQMQSRRYAKRQFTWIRGNMMSWKAHNLK